MRLLPIIAAAILGSTPGIAAEWPANDIQSRAGRASACADYPTADKAGNRICEQVYGDNAISPAPEIHSRKTTVEGPCAAELAPNGVYDSWYLRRMVEGYRVPPLPKPTC